MTGEEALGWLIGLLQTWGPLALIIGGIFFLIVFSLVIFIFVKIFRDMRRMDKEFDRRSRGRWW